MCSYHQNSTATAPEEEQRQSFFRVQFWLYKPCCRTNFHLYIFFEIVSFCKIKKYDIDILFKAKIILYLMQWTFNNKKKSWHFQIFIIHISQVCKGIMYRFKKIAYFLQMLNLSSFFLASLCIISLHVHVQLFTNLLIWKVKFFLSSQHS